VRPAFGLIPVSQKPPAPSPPMQRRSFSRSSARPGSDRQVDGVGATRPGPDELPFADALEDFPRTDQFDEALEGMTWTPGWPSKLPARYSMAGCPLPNSSVTVK
jgi:hypothetical protein